MSTTKRLLWLPMTLVAVLRVPPLCCNGLDPEITAAAQLQQQRQRQIATSYATIDSRSCYRSIEGINQSMKDLATKYPNLVTVEAIGESFIKKNGGGGNNKNESPGFDIYAVNVTDAKSVRKSSQKGKLLITASVHAREYTPTELLARFIEMMVDGFTTNDAQIKTILRNTEIHAIIHVNPDGRYKAENFPDSYWRKNTDPSGNCKDDTSYGVDINRNFDFMWGDTSGASNNPCADDYFGSSANSEPETQALVNYAKRIFPESQRKSDPEKQMDVALGDDIMGMYIDLHSSGEFIYYPWGHKDATCADDDAFQAIARKFHYHNKYALWASGFEFQYAVSGDTSDYMYAVMGVASMGMELGFDFYDDCNTFESDILTKNLPVLSYAASIAGRPFALAKGPDILDISVDYSDMGIIVTAEVSDGSLVNSLAGESDHVTGDQDIVKVVVYLDVYPDDYKDGENQKQEMSPLDGAFDSGEEIAQSLISTGDLSSGRHTLHIQALDSNGYRGPVRSVSFQVEKAETTAPSKTPTRKPTVMPTRNPTTTPPSPNPSTSSPTPPLPTTVSPNTVPLSNSRFPTVSPSPTPLVVFQATADEDHSVTSDNVGNLNPVNQNSSPATEAFAGLRLMAFAVTSCCWIVFQ